MRGRAGRMCSPPPRASLTSVPPMATPAPAWPSDYSTRARAPPHSARAAAGRTTTTSASAPQVAVARVSRPSSRRALTVVVVVAADGAGRIPLSSSKIIGVANSRGTRRYAAQLSALFPGGCSCRRPPGQPPGGLLRVLRALARPRGAPAQRAEEPWHRLGPRQAQQRRDGAPGALRRPVRRVRARPLCPVQLLTSADTADQVRRSSRSLL
jgi:hypothetical protein